MGRIKEFKGGFGVVLVEFESFYDFLDIKVRFEYLRGGYGMWCFKCI